MLVCSFARFSSQYACSPPTKFLSGKTNWIYTGNSVGHCRTVGWSTCTTTPTVLQCFWRTGLWNLRTVLSCFVQRAVLWTIVTAPHILFISHPERNLCRQVLVSSKHLVSLPYSNWHIVSNEALCKSFCSLKIKMFLVFFCSNCVGFFNSQIHSKISQCVFICKRTIGFKKPVILWGQRLGRSSLTPSTEYITGSKLFLNFQRTSTWHRGIRWCMENTTSASDWHAASN